MMWKSLFATHQRGCNDDLSWIGIAFLQIHVPTEDDETQDLRLMAKFINGLFRWCCRERCISNPSPKVEFEDIDNC